MTADSYAAHLNQTSYSHAKNVKFTYLYLQITDHFVFFLNKYKRSFCI